MGILIGGIILRSAFGLLSESSKVLLESAPEGIDIDDVIKIYLYFILFLIIAILKY